MTPEYQTKLNDAILKVAGSQGIESLIELQEDLLAPINCAPPPKSIFNRLTLKQLRAMPPKSWLVDQIFGPQDLGVIYGPSGCGKTFVVIDMIIKFCLGKRWANRFEIQKPLNVIYCAGEGYSGLASRFDAACIENRVDDLENFSFFDNVPQLFNPECEDNYLSFIAHCQQTNLKPDLLIIDTFHSAINDGDENFSKEMGTIIRATRTISKSLGCAILLVHHTNKEEIVERGSTSLRASSDFMISIKKSENLGGTNAIMSCSKNKDGEMWKNQNFNLAPVDDCESVCVKWDEIESEEAITLSKQGNKAKILKFLSFYPERGFTSNSIADEIRCDRRKASIYLAELYRDKKCERGFKDPNSKKSPDNPWAYFHDKNALVL